MTAAPSVWRRLARHLRPEVATLAAAYACMLVLNAATVAYAALLGPGLDLVFRGDLDALLRSPDQRLRPVFALVPSAWVGALEDADPATAAWVLPAFIVGVAVIKGIAQTGQFFLFGRASQRVLLALRGEAFAALLRQTPAFFASRSQGDLLSRLTNDANEVERAFFYGFGSLLRDSLGVVGLLGFAITLDPTLALLTLITVPAALLPLTRFTAWMKRVSRRGQGAQADVGSVAYEALAGAQLVQAFGNEDHERRRLDRAARRYYQEMLRSYFIRAVRTPTMEVLGAVALAALFVLLASRVHAVGGDPAHYVSFLGSIFLMYDPLKKLGRVSDYLAAGATAAERLFEVIDRPPDVTDLPGAKELALTDREGAHLVCEAVRFAYRDGETVLDGVSFEAAPGTCVALVGRSGAGKSTLAALIPRFYEPGSGRITLDGTDVRTVSLASLRRQIGVVHQETFLFNASVADNIAYGALGASEEAIRAAARAAHADEFIDALPNGYATLIGERGVTLSGGQRQRLAIARAFLRDPPLLILDEATSNLDADSERHIQQALDRLTRGRTTLVIAHRLTTVRRADLICVLQGGRIAERGTHDALIAAGGEYARLVGMQLRDDDGAWLAGATAPAESSEAP